MSTERTPEEQLIWAIFSNEHEADESEVELEDLAYLMNEHPDAAEDFLPLGKVQG